VEFEPISHEDHQQDCFSEQNYRSNKIEVLKLNYLQLLLKLLIMTGIRFTFNGESTVVEFVPLSHRSNSRTA